tara:strand:+ start:1190 stop:2677 length:1488 start_codon:yes stop_codon:yes gene_type:complete
MAKKTRIELSTLAINTNLPDNTQELITPTTERSQLTDERESVVNYKDDLGGAPNAGKFLTVAVDGESLTMVNEPSGVPDWVTFITAVVNQMLLKAGGDGTGTSQSSIKFTSYDGSITSQINFNGIDGSFYINGSQSQIQLTTAINFIIGGTPRLTISSGGNVGIGTSTLVSTAQLTVYGSYHTDFIRDYYGGPRGYLLRFGANTASSGHVIGSQIAGSLEANDVDGGLEFYTLSSGTLAERLRISSGGDVGINNTIPSSFFGNASQLVIGDGSTSRGMTIYSSATADGQIFFADGTTGADQYRGILRYEHSSDALVFFTNATEKMRISSGGDVYIGNSSISTAQTAIFLQKSGIITNVYAYSSGSITLMEFYKQSAGIIGTISYNGTDTLYNATSDYRLKEDLKDYNGIDFISKIKTYNFKWKNTDIRSYGVMAHELQEVFPNCVTGEKDALDDNGEIIPQGVDYSKIVPMLTKAIQEQQTIIEDLKARIEKLEL